MYGTFSGSYTLEKIDPGLSSFDFQFSAALVYNRGKADSCQGKELSMSPDARRKKSSVKGFKFLVKEFS